MPQSSLAHSNNLRNNLNSLVLFVTGSVNIIFATRRTIRNTASPRVYILRYSPKS
jgi:hypothetical protein